VKEKSKGKKKDFGKRKPSFESQQQPTKWFHVKKYIFESFVLKLLKAICFACKNKNLNLHKCSFFVISFNLLFGFKKIA
jgi:hypothetical protein